MTIAELTEVIETQEPRIRRWTREEYYTMDEVGLFDLIALLNSFGYYPNNCEEAMDLAEELFSNGY